MKYLLFSIFIFFTVSTTVYAGEVSLKEFQTRVGVPSSHAWFKGFFYIGSDDSFHYFTEEWESRVDPEYKIKKELIEIAGEFPLGEKRLGFSPIEGYGYKLFFMTGGRKYFKWD